MSDDLKTPESIAEAVAETPYGWGSQDRRRAGDGEFSCGGEGCEMVADHAGDCGKIEIAYPEPRTDSSLVGRDGAARALLNDVFVGGAKRVVVIGDRDAGEPNLHGEDGIQKGIWNPGARSVHGFEPAASEATEFGPEDGATVQGFSEAERRAAYRAFLKVKRAIVEMTEASDPAGFVKKLREAASHLGPEVARKLDAAVASFVALPSPSEIAPGLLDDGDE